MSERVRSTVEKAPLEKIITLVVPFEIEGVVTPTVTVRRLKVRDRLDVQAASGSDVEKEVLLLAKAMGCAPSDLDDMDMADYMACQEALESFFSARSGTSAKSS